MKSTEKWGVDVDTAVDLALQELHLSREEVNVEVLEESSSGIFGIRSKLAKVRVTSKDEALKDKKEKGSFDDIDDILANLPENSTQRLSEEFREEFDKFEKEEREDAKAREYKRSNPKKYSVSNPGEILKDEELDAIKNTTPLQDHEIKQFLDGLFRVMNLDVECSIRANDTIVYIDVTGKDAATVIGKRGANLEAFQSLSSYVMRGNQNNKIRVVFDSENYRRRREKALWQLANRLAHKVVHTKRSIKLEPMSSYERKVIHSALQNNPKVRTRSEGDSPYRKVVIELK